MRVNIYAEEMTGRIEIISKEIDGRTYTGLRFYLELPATIACPECRGKGANSMVPCSRCASTGKVNVSGPFMHRPGDDDSAAVTFWGKRDLRALLNQALDLLDAHYAESKKE